MDKTEISLNTIGQCYQINGEQHYAPNLLVSHGSVTVKIGDDWIDVEKNELVDMLVWEPLTFWHFTDL